MKFLTFEDIKKNWKRYAFSTLVTFITGFLAVIIAELDGITQESIKMGVLGGILFSALRGGVKAVFEFIVSILRQMKYGV